MNPDLFLTLARTLVNSPQPGPAECRTAISRVYYAAFHSLLRFIELELGVAIQTAGGRDNTHLLLQHYLVNSNVPFAAKVGRKLRDLLDSRKEADYDFDKAQLNSPSQAMTCIARADDLLQHLELLRQHPIRQQLIAGLTQYKKLRQGLS